LKTYEAANDIVKTLSGKEKDFLGASRNEPWVNPDDAGNSSKKIAKRIVVNDRKTGEPVSFIEIEDTGNRIGQIGIATKSGDRYRGKGYASEAVKQGKKWFDRYGHKNLDMMEWIANNENVASINLAKKHGFEKVKMKDVHPEWGDYPDYTIMVYRGKGKVDRILGK
jgi:RimJ/RimL family protein N-acetyltransferase